MPTFKPTADHFGVLVAPCGSSHTLLVWIDTDDDAGTLAAVQLARSVTHTREVTHLLAEDVLEELRTRAHEEYWRGQGGKSDAESD